MPISEERFKKSAQELGCSLAAIKAVTEVESGGKGFLSTGEPIILFEPHIFWKELKKRGIDPNAHVAGNEDILYPKWGTKPYGKPSQQHARLARAVKINRDAALSSASWGMFQICGFNWSCCGVQNLQEFITRMYRSEDDHLDMFDNYIKCVGLDDELRGLDWAGFARGYNGPQYTKNQYDKKLARAYAKYNV